MKKIIVIASLLFGTSSLFAAYVGYTNKVNNVRVIHWAEDRACIEVGDKWFKLDMSTEKGKLTYALALTAYTSGKQLTVGWQDTSPLEGGCDTGTTMHPIYNIQFLEE